MTCKKCRREIQDGSIFCNFCGKKQTETKARYRKRPNGMGTISKDARYKNPYIAHAPSSKMGSGRVYIGAFLTMREAQEAIDKYVKEGRPELYNATLADIYNKWSDVHFKRVSDSAISLYSSMWKRFADIQGIKIRELRTVHFQEIVNKATSKSACDTLKAMSVMLCKFAMENDIVSKNYAEFIKIPKFEKKEKKIFTKEAIECLWRHAGDKDVQVILFMIYTGLRIGEVVALKKSDTHLDDGYIVCGEKTEAGRNRVVPLPPNIPELTEFLRDWMGSTEGDRILDITIPKLRNNFYDTLNRYEINDRHYTPHCTRHTFASISAASGIHPENLQKIIGHSDFTTTANIYLHQDVETLCREMKKISR